MNATAGTTRRVTQRRLAGFSLLEVLLALVILGGAIAVIGELIRFGAQNSRKARNLTRAEILCDSILSEIVAGSLPAQPASLVPVEDEIDPEGNPRFAYSVDVQPTDQEGLLAVSVTVTGALPNDPSPVEFTLSRLLIDPQYVFPEPPVDDTPPGDSTTSGSGTNSTNSTGGQQGNNNSGSGNPGGQPPPIPPGSGTVPLPPGGVPPIPPGPLPPGVPNFPGN
jgi:prepilin-type N-terminal cleavage/methylation domain-containing protein